jgi:cytidine deaminase
MTDEDLLQAAREARSNAYAPYSHFTVGAAVLTEDGQVFGGCNMENAAYPESVCAEGVALGAMVVGGGRRVRRVAISAGPQGQVHPTLPCGGCRQKILEFAGPDTTVVIDGATRTYALAELLPAAFGKADLDRA